ncbi:nucleotide-diphospho-sugar transferase [Lineolata rhizophorae]|uniref:Mannose-1-phosphate guanyltransferase n=1 Tax=Lineolata rhizophorae TaxID=578093 RepID=A0A6A6P0Z5_9PEZI|nr:nucleotide-diphospho-sugar transferase [Lineolata rhizophorae]
MGPKLQRRGHQDKGRGGGGGGRGGGGGGGGGGGEDERDEPLQAVVLADPFETRFSPFTLERPRCLLPLANTPLIEYTFEFLANAGVEEIYLYCGAHTDMVEKYIWRSKWSSRSSPFAKLELIRSTSRSIGDAMRDLDKRALLHEDFLVVYGDVVANLPLEPALAAHRARRAKDKNAIMTMVLREAGTRHRTKAQETMPVFVLNPSTNRCLQYEQLAGRPTPHEALTVDADILKEHDEVEVRQDLIDCGIDICTPDVLALWSDNFDYEEPRRGFLHSVLKDYELNGKTVHAHVADEHYAARVRNLRAYDAVSRDVLARWAYPLCPDSNLLRGQSYKLLRRGGVYQEDGVMLARSCVVGARTVLGRDASIGDGSVVTDSVLGRGCFVGKNVRIDGAYIWDRAVIGDGSVVRRAVVADEAMVGKECRVEPGALVSFGVTIADGVTVKGSSRITREKRERDGEEHVVRGEPDVAVVGQGGDGFEFVDEDEDEFDEVTDTGLVYKLGNLSLSSESVSTIHSEDELSDASDDATARTSQSGARSGSFVSLDSADDAEDKQAARLARDFHHDAATSLFDSLQRGDKSEDMMLELTALRMTANASEHMTRRAVAAAFARRVAALAEGGAGLGVRQAAREALRPHKSLIGRTMFDRGDRSGRKSDQVDFLLLLQEELTKRENGGSIMLFVANELYDLDVVEQEGFEQWWEDGRSMEGEGRKRVREGMRQFMEVLLAEDDDDEEEEEESEED